MTSSNQPAQTPLGTVGAMIFGLAIVFCSMEMVPARGIFHPGWSPILFYLIMMLVGLGSGAMIGGRYWLPGMLGGLVAGPGALLLIVLYLHNVDVAYKGVMAVLGILGAFPGIGLYFGLKKLQDALVESRDGSSPKRGHQRQRDEWDDEAARGSLE